MRFGIVAAAAVSAVVSFLVVGVIRRHAARFGLLDRPNNRSSHRIPTPRGGGIGIVLGAGAGLLVASLAGEPLSGAAGVVFLAAVCVAAVGLVDDLRRVGPGVRLLTQILAAGAVVAATGPVSRVPLPEPLAFPIPPVVGWMLSCLWITAVTNFFNFMDGIDGLAGGQAAASFAAILFAWWSPHAGMLAVCAGAASLTFLVHNWSPARIFMGDVGSGFLGFLLATLPFLAPAGQRGDAVLAVAIGLTLFLVDPVETLIRRAYEGKRLTEAHREHVYQQLLDPGAAAGSVAAALVVTGGFLGILGASTLRAPRVGWLAVAAAASAYLLERRFASSRVHRRLHRCATEGR